MGTFMKLDKKKAKKVVEERKPGVGTVYIFKMKLRHLDEYVYKIGVCQNTRRPIDRLLEVLRSFWTKYQYIPDVTIKRHSRTDEIFEKESALHYHFGLHQYIPSKATNGSTELFTGIDEEYLLDTYRRCLDGEDVRKLDQYRRTDVGDTGLGQD